MKLIMNRATGKYSRVRPVKKDSLEMQIAKERITSQWAYKVPKHFRTFDQFLKWLNNAPNYQLVDFGLDIDPERQ